MRQTIPTRTSWWLLALILISGSYIGISSAAASEVQGTLSSDTTAATGTSGVLVGSVIDNQGTRSSSGGTRTRLSTPAPAGLVLGVQATAAQNPTFPNAGMLSFDQGSHWWSTVAPITAIFMLFMASLTLYYRFTRLSLR